MEHEAPSDAPYAQLAMLITARRGDLGLSQSRLAMALDVKQQTVSRWESGTHRPSVNQIPALAKLLEVPAADLMRLAAYGAAVASTITSLFPVEALDPQTFERFVADVAAGLYPGAEVHLQGGPGHTQGGSDVIARLPDGRVLSFQCKRVERFGPADIARAIAAHSISADQKILVLSKIASPKDFETVAAHGWSLWDRQRLTREIRTLPIETQERLVDLYFRGQRMALLGRDEPGPWLTLEEYFAPFEQRRAAGRGAIFTHKWSLVGRDEQLGRLAEALDAPAGETPDSRFVLVVGPGGIGKTRILKEAVSHYQRRSPATRVRFLSTAQEATPVSLGNLGRGAKLLVIDDAHDRDGLKLVIEYVTNANNDAKLLIASRPYAEQRISNELGIYSIVQPSLIRLGRLDKASLLKLVTEVLAEFKGNTEMAEAIAAIASDSPLIAAMAAHVVAVEGQFPELARGEEKLRRFVLARFAKVITGHLGSSSDAPLLRSVLEVLALVQPFHIDDRRLAELVQINAARHSPADVDRALKLLVDGSVIYKRGAVHRLMPDLLGDFLIEDSCIGADGRLTPFAENIAKSLEDNRLTQLMVNLGRTDWRLKGGDPTRSDLLEPIWRMLQAIDSQYDPRIDAVESVAYYQPAQALDFIQSQIDQGRRFPQFGRILKSVTYTPEHRADALQLLWDLGRCDGSARPQDLEHPIRILNDLVGYGEDKPVDFIEEVAEFGFALMDDPEAWESPYTPFDILKPLLSGEGNTISASSRGISMSPFFVAYDVVAKLRTRLIDRIIDLLEAKETRVALQAARMVNEAIRPPVGMLKTEVPLDLAAKYDAEFLRTFDRIESLVRNGTLAPTTVIGLIRSLEWHATYGDGALCTTACRIFAQIPEDLDFRFHAAVAEGAEYTFVGQVKFSQWTEGTEWLQGLVDEVREVYEDADKLCDALVAKLDVVAGAGLSVFPANQLVDKLVAAAPEIGAAIIRRSMQANTRLRDYLGYAVGALLETRPEEGRALIRQALASSDPRIRSSGAHGLVWIRRQVGPDDLNLVGEALRADDSNVVSVAIHALMQHQLSAAQKVALLSRIDFLRDPGLVNAAANALCHPSRKQLDDLTRDEVWSFLKRLVVPPRLDGHWLHELLEKLSQRHGLLVAQLVLNRAEHRLTLRDDDRFEVWPYWRRHQNLGLEKSPDAAAILDRVWSWLSDHDNGVLKTARFSAGATIAAMFNLGSQPVVDFLDRLVDRAIVGCDLEGIGDILRHCEHRFVIKNHKLVEHLLKRCQMVEPDSVKTIIGQLGAAAFSGSWSGLPGEPMPRDLSARDETRKILASISRLSPAFSLYRSILDASERNIERSRAEGRVIDDEEF